MNWNVEISGFLFKISWKWQGGGMNPVGGAADPHLLEVRGLSLGEGQAQVIASSGWLVTESLVNVV